MVKQWLAALVRGYFFVLSRVAPGLASRHAERLFTAPPRYSGYARPVTRARKDCVAVGMGKVAVRSRGPGDAGAVMLAHGWGGVAEQMEPFVAPLVERGYRVVWFDQPGHGDSRAAQVTIADFVRAMRAVERAYGPFQAAVAHSLGASALALALRQGMLLERAVFISPPASIREQAGAFARMLGISQAVVERMRRRLERRAGMPFAEIDRIDDLQRVQLPALFLHDADDTVVPYENTRRISSRMPNALRVKTQGLGHYRILRDSRVVRAVVDFVRPGPFLAG
jgi:pimeloyl-ACP methyl ester carboxylesterase